VSNRYICTSSSLGARRRRSAPLPSLTSFACWCPTQVRHRRCRIHGDVRRRARVIGPSGACCT
jgi:hypothetical protein